MVKNRFIVNRLTLVMVVLLYSIVPVSTQTAAPSYIQMANFRTAQRCLELAKNALINFNYDEAYYLVLTGLDYDNTIPDLWYLKALLLSYQDGKRYEIIEAVETSLQGGQWLYYTPEAARILTAQVLVKTGSPKKALEILDAKPLVITSDAEYIRADACYKISEVQKAREIISRARKSFPKDTRFPLLFFAQERFTYDEGDAYYKELLQSLLVMTDTWKETDADVLLFASYFLQGSQKERFLKEYRLKENKNPLFIAAFLEAGLLSELDAVTALFSYAESRISGPAFFEVLSLLRSEESFMAVAEKLSSYSGTLVFDTTNDGENDFYVSYSYGRPSTLSFDENADGKQNWLIELDYGVPVKMFNYEQDVELYYGRYPYITTVLYTEEHSLMEIQLVDGSVDWQPFSMETVPIAPNLVFYLPVLAKHIEYIPQNLFLQNASDIIIKNGLHSENSIRFTMRDSLPKTAVYTANSQPYAYGFFEDGILVFRNVDIDRNGSYEVSEMYAFNPEVSSLYLTEEQSSLLYKNLFGSLPANEGLFVTKVIGDTNENSLIDFMEEYLNDGTTKTSWDSDEDGNWDISYEKKDIPNKGIEETITFIHPIDKKQAVMKFENKEPVYVTIGQKQTTVTKHPDLPFYWIGSVPDASFALRAINELKKEDVQGLRILIKPEGNLHGLVLAIKINNLYFGEFIDE